MQLVVKNGEIIATHRDDQQIEGLYEGAEIYTIPDGTPVELRKSFTWNKLSLKNFLDSIRKKRDHLLLLSDWTQLPDCKLSVEQKAQWAVYRQALRDLPSKISQAGQKIPWPKKPSGNQGFSDADEIL